MMSDTPIYPAAFEQAVRLILFLWVTLLPVASVASDASLPSLLAKAEELNTISAKLVQAAQSGKTDASSFRIEATLYREHLRALMLDNRKIAEEKERIPQDILIEMVRMSALLHSAAECKTGRYIVCPPELMTQLTSQQQLVSKSFDGFKATQAGTS
jgi:hypothetical protein